MIAEFIYNIFSQKILHKYISETLFQSLINFFFKAYSFGLKSWYQIIINIKKYSLSSNER